MSKVPGMPSNGAHRVQVPPDIAWDESNPIFIHSCSQHVNHAHDCDRKDCTSWAPTESEVKLLNEGRAWARVGMSFHGVPTCIANQVPGIAVNIYDLKLRIETMQSLLIEAGVFTAEECDERFREIKLADMQRMRAESEETVKQQQLQQMMAVPDHRILGPNGEPL